MIHLALALVCAWTLWHLARGAPYFPSRREAIEAMVRVSGAGPGTRMADIGAGDGRILLAFGRAGAHGVGIEIHPVLVFIGNWRLRRAGLSDRMAMRRANMWKTDFSGYDVVTVYGMDHVMPHLEKKLRRELKPGALVCSHYYRFPAWPVHHEEDGVIFYTA